MPVPVERILEKDVCKSLRDFWKKQKFFYIRNQQGIGSKRGTADYTVVKNGFTAWVEAKSPVGKQSAPQAEFQKQLEAVGGFYIVVHSLDEFIERWKERNGKL
jgi:hypothetical protein